MTRQVSQEIIDVTKQDGLNIGVLIKQVPIPDEMKTGADGLMDRSGKSMMNPHCKHALEEALKLKDKLGGKITIFSMGPPNFTQSMDEALRKGADRAYLLSDRKLGGSDTWATAEALATLINWVQDNDDEELDVLFAGLQTIDGDTAHVGPQVAGRIGLRQVTYVENIEILDDGYFEVRRKLKGGYQKFKVPAPVLFSITSNANTPRGPSLSSSVAALDKETEIVDIETIGLPEENAGLSGSPTIVSRVKNVTVERGPVQLFEEGSMQERVQNLLEEIDKSLGSGTDDEEDDDDELTEEEKKQKERIERKKKRDKNLPYVDLRDGARGIGVWAQTEGKNLSDAALEILGEAKRVSHKLDEDSQKITAVVIGPNSSEHTEELIHHGADAVYVIEDERIKDYMTLPYTRALCQAIEDINPEIFLFSASTMGRDLAPRVAAILDVGISADCTEFDVGYYSSRKKGHRFKKAFKMKRPSFGESKLATIIGPWTYPQMATARPGTFKPLPKDESREGEVIEFEPTFEEVDWSIELLESVRNPETVELEKSDIVISGGFGVGKDGFGLMKELVNTIRANGQDVELGASRKAVDAGFIPYEHQVGQTGKTVRPEVYFAFGISGAIQHITGMKDSEKVVAINTDPDAKIFDNADFGLVADFRDAVPPLIKEVKDGYKFPVGVEDKA